MKKIILSSLLFTSLLVAEATKVCTVESVVEYNPVGDTRGNTVLSKKEVVRDCNVTETINGECIKWQYNNERTSIPMEAYNGFDTRDYGDTIGQFFAAAGAYDQLEHLWSGFRGHCISGTLQDFDWVSDPMFWGSLAMDYLMAGGEAGFVSDGLNSVATKAGSTVMSKEVANKVVVNEVKKQAKTLTKQMVTSALDKAAASLGRCMIGGAVNLGFATAEYLSDGAGDMDEFCNPVDEICNENETVNDQSDIMTMDYQQFQDLRDSYEAEGEDIEKYIEILDDGMDTGVVAYRMKTMDETPGIENMNNEELEKIKKKFKMYQAGISIATTAGKLGACAMGWSDQGSVGQSSAHPNATGQRADIESGLNAAISIGTGFIPPPAGPAIGAALKVVLAVATSFQSVDTCSSEEDAQRQGSRHEKTQKALQFNLCRPLYDTCEDEWIWGGCCLTAYEYCCYDQLLTKVLVEQLKAELGRDWSNCTGISLRDLNYVSFRQCTASEMADGLDGAHQYGLGWNPKDAFQYKHKCMDLTEFKDYLRDIIGEEIDTSTFDDYWNNLMSTDPI